MQRMEWRSLAVFALLLTCLISGCAGAMSDLVIAIDMENFVDRRPGQLSGARIEVVDLRRDSVLRRTAFNASLGEIKLAPPESELVERLVANALSRVVGHSREDGQLPVVSCGIKTFDIVTPATPFYWDVTTRIELILRIEGKDRKASAEAVERTWVYPSESILRSVTTRALHDVAISVEQELRALLAGEP